MNEQILFNVCKINVLDAFLEWEKVGSIKEFLLKGVHCSEALSAATKPTNVPLVWESHRLIPQQTDDFWELSV